MCIQGNPKLREGHGQLETEIDVSRLGAALEIVWNYTRHFSRSSQTVETLTENGRNITNDEDKAEILNNFFASVLTVEPDSNLPFAKPPPKDIKYILEDIEVTPDMVRKKLIHLKANKANGPDNISTNVLRKCPDLDQPLTIIYNQSIQRGSMPQDWRDANITPLFKKGFRTLASNYRPISLTSQVVKILERILSDHIWDLLHKNDFVSCDQHGFRAGCSCVTQLLECLHDWTGNFDKKISTDIVYLDFSKAFDSVPHKRLIYKLKLAGIRGKVLRWVECFLSNRRQRVILRNGCSHWEKSDQWCTSGINSRPPPVLNICERYPWDRGQCCQNVCRWHQGICRDHRSWCLQIITKWSDKIICMVKGMASKLQCN